MTVLSPVAATTQNVQVSSKNLRKNPEHISIWLDDSTVLIPNHRNTISASPQY